MKRSFMCGVSHGLFVERTSALMHTHAHTRACLPNRLVSDPDPHIQEQALAILRNMTSDSGGSEVRVGDCRCMCVCTCACVFVCVRVSVYVLYVCGEVGVRMRVCVGMHACVSLCVRTRVGPTNACVCACRAAR